MLLVKRHIYLLLFLTSINCNAQQSTKTIAFDSVEVFKEYFKIFEELNLGKNLDNNIRQLEKLAKILKAQNDSIFYVRSHYGIAIALMHKKQIGDFIQYEKNIFPYLSVRDTFVTDVFNLLGTAHLNNEDFPKTINYFTKAKKYLSQHYPEDCRSLADLYNNEAKLYMKIGEHEKAESLLLQQISLNHCYEKSYRDLLKVYTLNDLASLNTSIGKNILAVEQLNEALNMCEINPVYYARIRDIILQNLANALIELNRNKEAIYYTNKITPVKNNKSYKNYSIGLIQAKSLLGQNQYQKAIDTINYYLMKNQLYRKGKFERIANLNKIKAQSFLSLKEYKKALKAIDQSLEEFNYYGNENFIIDGSFEWVKNPISTLKAIHTKANIYKNSFLETQSQNDLVNAYTWYFKTTQFIEHIRNSLYWDGSKIILQSLSKQILEEYLSVAYQFYLNLKDISILKEIFQVFQNNKSSILINEQFYEAKIKNTNTGLALKSDLDYLKFDELRINSQLKDIKINNYNTDSLNLLMNRKKQIHLRRKSIYARLLLGKENNRENLISFDKIRSNLSKHHLILDYFLGAKQLYILAYSKNEVRFYKITIDEKFIRNINNYLVLLKNRNSDFKSISKHSHALYKLLIPISNVNNYNLITIIPDEQLHFIPFSTLMYKKPNKVSWQSAPFLINSTEINYQLSSFYLDPNFKKFQRSSKDALIFRPSFIKSENFTELINEDPIIEVITEAWDSKILNNEKASKSNLLDNSHEDYDIFHLSSHAQIDSLNLLNSWIACSPENEKDNRINLYELSNLPFSASIVNLSACQTGAGILLKGEGINGFVRTFIQKRFKSVLSALWDINDWASSVIMKQFYIKLHNSKTKSESLKEATLEYLHSENISNALKHPYYWSAFKLTGDPSTIDKRNNFNYITSLVVGILFLAIVFIMTKRVSLFEDY